MIRLTPLFLSILKLDHRAAIRATAVRNLTAGEKVLLMSEQKIRYWLVGIIIIIIIIVTIIIDI